MANIQANPLITLKRVVGNLEDIGAQLLDMNGDAVNVTGITILFRMVLISDGTVKVNNASGAIVTANEGKVKYSPSSGDMDTAGKYACYFIDDAAVDRLWPYDGAKFVLEIIAETAT